MNKKTVKDIDLKGKRVFVRADFNVPLDENRNITDDARIQATLPTINYLLDQGSSVVLASHLGRPDGQVVEELRLDPVAQRLEALLGRSVRKLNDCIGPDVEAAAKALQPGEVLLLENVRFHAEEEANDADFAAQLARLGEVYVNDAFGTAHRAHATTAGIAAHLRPAVAGLLMARELDFLSNLLENPKRPFVAILGGAKVKDKLGVIDNLTKVVDTLLIGGGMAYTFFKAEGYEVGSSLLDDKRIDACRELLERVKRDGTDMRLPTDVLITDRDAEDADTQFVPVDRIPADRMGMDVGPATVAEFKEVIAGAGTIFWNGPMGRFEVSRFAEGTRAIAAALAECSAVTVIGGGDSGAAVMQMGFADRMTHISTGGGASLEYLEGKTLPGVAALDDK